MRMMTYYYRYYYYYYCCCFYYTWMGIVLQILGGYHLWSMMMKDGGFGDCGMKMLVIPLSLVIRGSHVVMATTMMITTI
jgi:hypothetical protein